MRISARTKDQGKYRSTHLEVFTNWVGDRRVFMIRDGNTGIQYQLRPHQALKLATELNRAFTKDFA